MGVRFFDVRYLVVAKLVPILCTSVDTFFLCRVALRVHLDNCTRCCIVSLIETMLCYFLGIDFYLEGGKSAVEGSRATGDWHL